MPDISTSILHFNKNMTAISVFECGIIANSLFDYTSFQVIASFERSFYLFAHNSHKEQLICFCKDSLEIGPLNALCRQWPEGNLPARGTTFQLNEAYLYGENLIIDISQRLIWTPKQKHCFNSEKTAQGLQKAMGIMAERSPEKLGLAVILFKPNALSPFLNFCQKAFEGKAIAYAKDKIATHIASNQVLYNMSIDGLKKLCAWLQGQEAEPQQGIVSLIGLGSGLTPSGDDVLGGVLIGLHLQGDIYRARQFTSNLQDFLEHTNVISRAHLYAASQGMGAAPLHDFSHAIMTNQDSTVLNAIAKRIDTIGHSSGWDATLGIFLGLCASLSHFHDN